MMIQRVHFVEAVKHPWRLDMAKTVEAGGSETQGHDGFTGKVEFTETPYGLVMDGFRRRLVQKDDPFLPRMRVFTPWANVKWCEHEPPELPGQDAPRTAGLGERGTRAQKDRALGA